MFIDDEPEDENLQKAIFKMLVFYFLLIPIIGIALLLFSWIV